MDESIFVSMYDKASMVDAQEEDSLNGILVAM